MLGLRANRIVACNGLNGSAAEVPLSGRSLELVGVGAVDRSLWGVGTELWCTGEAHLFGL